MIYDAYIHVSVNDFQLTYLKNHIFSFYPNLIPKSQKHSIELRKNTNYPTTHILTLPSGGNLAPKPRAGNSLSVS